MDMIGRIRRLHGRKKKSQREISRMTGLSRNTVAKWLHGEVDGPPKYRRGEQPNKLTVFHETVRVFNDRSHTAQNRGRGWGVFVVLLSHTKS